MRRRGNLDAAPQIGSMVPQYGELISTLVSNDSPYPYCSSCVLTLYWYLYPLQARTIEFSNPDVLYHALLFRRYYVPPSRLRSCSRELNPGRVMFTWEPNKPGKIAPHMGLAAGPTQRSWTELSISGPPLLVWCKRTSSRMKGLGFVGSSK